MLCEHFQTTIYYQFKNKDQFNRLAQVLTDITMNKDIINSKFKVTPLKYTIDGKIKKNVILCFGRITFSFVLEIYIYQ